MSGSYRHCFDLAPDGRHRGSDHGCIQSIVSRWSLDMHISRVCRILRQNLSAGARNHVPRAPQVACLSYSYCRRRLSQSDFVRSYVSSLFSFNLWDYGLRVARVEISLLGGLDGSRKKQVLCAAVGNYG